QNLEDIGVAMEIESVESGVYDSRMFSRDFDALGSIWNPVYDPDDSALLETDGWFNFYEYSNDEVDDLCDELESYPASDRESRLPVYKELNKVVSKDLPRLFLYSENELHAISTSVHGLAPH